MKVGNTTDICWEDPKNKKDRPVNRVSRIKNNSSETSTVKIFLYVQYNIKQFGHEIRSCKSAKMYKQFDHN